MNRKRTGRRMIPLLLACMLLAGCMGQFSSRTVVIPDTEEQMEEQAGGQGDFDIHKIYRLTAGDDADATLVGWADNDHVLGLFGSQGRERSIQQVDYAYNSRRHLFNLDGLEDIEGLAPDGTHLTAAVEDEENEQMKMIRLSDKKTTVIGSIPQGQIRTTPAIWSNNSRYVSYVVANRVQGEAMLFVYDITLRKGMSYPLPNTLDTGIPTEAKVSDNGTSALLVKAPAAQAIGSLPSESASSAEAEIAWVSLQGQGVTSLYEQSVSGGISPDYINNDQIVFVGPKGALTLYDRRNASTAVLLAKAGSFRLSRDRKFIAYSDAKESLYAARLQGNNMLNEKEIYKGILFPQIDWSPDNMKILISGWRAYDPRPTTAAPESVPFIIEFQ